MARRPSKGKKLKKGILIYSEGQTERIYFEALNRRFNASNIKVKPISIERQSKALVTKALKRIKKNEDSKNLNIEQAISLANKSKLGIKGQLKIGFSNESFEVWLLSHFENVLKYHSLTRKQTYQKLTTYLNVTDYEKLKADENLGNLFVELVKSAINIGIHFNQLPCQEMMQAPYTNLGWIVEEIYFQK
ncbi:RloB family protein [Enterococcus cecorum]|uniref:RloB family protein n=1 Tax=Enterococcus cecorum TaxID=44008 RepID=UPI00148E85CE|nr:RloB family protein [Enterococcus cecorum]